MGMLLENICIKPKTDQSGRDRLYLTSKGEYTDTGKQFREQGKSWGEVNSMKNVRIEYPTSNTQYNSIWIS